MNSYQRTFRPPLLRTLGALLALAACLFSACAQLQRQAEQPTPTPVTLTIAGSTEMRPLLTDLAAAYSEINPHLHVSLRGGGSQLGEQWLASGRADIAASAAGYPDTDLPADLVRILIGVDAIALIVHNDNPVEALTLEQIRDLFRGRALNWQNVGGRAANVLLVSREDGSAIRALFEERVMGEERVNLTAVVMSTGSEVIEYVAAHRAAIGYVSYAFLAQNGDPAAQRPDSGVQEVKALSVDGKMPFGPDLVDYQYPLVRPLYLLIRQNGAEAILEIIDFTLGEAGQNIVARYHIPVR